MRDKPTRAAQPFVCKKVKSPIGGLVLVGLKAKDSLLALERGGRQIRERRVAG